MPGTLGARRHIIPRPAKKVTTSPAGRARICVCCTHTIERPLQTKQKTTADQLALHTYKSNYVFKQLSPPSPEQQTKTIVYVMRRSADYVFLFLVVFLLVVLVVLVRGHTFCKLWDLGNICIRIYIYIYTHAQLLLLGSVVGPSGESIFRRSFVPRLRSCPFGGIHFQKSDFSPTSPLSPDSWFPSHNQMSYISARVTTRPPNALKQF